MISLLQYCIILLKNYFKKQLINYKDFQKYIRTCHSFSRPALEGRMLRDDLGNNDFVEHYGSLSKIGPSLFIDVFS